MVSALVIRWKFLSNHLHETTQVQNIKSRLNWIEHTTVHIHMVDKSVSGAVFEILCSNNLT